MRGNKRGERNWTASFPRLPVHGPPPEAVNGQQEIMREASLFRLRAKTGD
jgi:hypothetical protein